MQFTPDEVKQALATLNACGIKDDDATTALAGVLQIADSASYIEWLSDIREQINGVNDHERDRLLASQYGHDAVRVVLALALAHHG